MQIDHQQLFDQMAISIRRGQAAQYFFGDNLEGYFEGVTHRYAAGAGYMLHRRTLFRDFLSWCGDRLNDREAAESAVILPYGVRHNHGPSWWDELMLLRRRRAVALRIYSRRPNRLALAPLLDVPREKMSVYPAEGGVVLQQADFPLHVGVASSQPFRHDGTTERDGFFAPIFRTTQPETEFTLYVGFGRDPEQALQNAVRLREQDGVRQHKQSIYDLLTCSSLWSSDTDYNRALLWAKLSSLFMVAEEFGKGIWAGLPWFKDNWGRDTFIALPGTLLVSGQFEEAREVIRNFLRWQNKDLKSKDYGRIPNRVGGPQNIIYNTTDGTPWLIRELLEYLHYTGDTLFAEEVYPAIKLALDGAIKNFCDAKGFLTHDDADTWMDARIQGQLPWSARGNRANDIQVLWHTALCAGGRLATLTGDRASARKWATLAAKLRTNFPKLFWDPKKKRMADRVNAKNKPDFKMRPNQLMLLSVPLDQPFLTEDQAEHVVANAVSELLYPYGIASLSQKDACFHPYHHRDDLWHFDAPYHNGTVWGWNAGFTTTALCRRGQTELAWSLAQNLARQILSQGCRGCMSELIDAIPDPKGKLTLSGTWQQAWSTSEFARNGYQDFGGFRPRLLDGALELNPHLPEDWENLSASYPFGRDGRLNVSFTRQHGKEVYLLGLEGPTTPLNLTLSATAFGQHFVVRQSMKHGDTLTVVLDAKQALCGLNGQWNPKPLKGVKQAKVRPLKFAEPSLNAKPPALANKDYLQKIIEAGKFA
jgi:glycogen debranching enzyme